MRADFEKWWSISFLDLEGGYGHVGKYSAWQAWRQAIAHDRANQPAASGVPEGWRLVPIEPTQAMIDAVVENSFLHESREKFEIITRSDWRDMLAAAPEAPKP